MKKYSFCILFLLLPFSLIHAQDDDNDIGNGEITFEETLIGLTYYRFEREIGSNIVSKLLEDNQAALNIFETAHLKRDFATIGAGAGVAAIIFSATTAFNEGFNWGIAAAGAGLIGVGVYLYSDSKSDAKEAVRVYNNSLQQESESGMALKLGLTSTGVGITMSF